MSSAGGGAPYPGLEMPELPEAEVARQEIEKALGRRIAAVDDADGYVCRPHAPGEIDAALAGRTLTAARRRGKFLWVETDDGGPDLGLHLGMAGRIVLDAEPAPNHWDRFALTFEDGGRLALRDKRRLGRAVIDPDYSHVGPDAGEITRDAFRERVGKGSAPLKARLLDQAALAGVGNLLADETLWQARLSPNRASGSLGEGELDHLRRELRKAIRSAIRQGGVHTGEFIDARRRGHPCPRCATTVHRATVGGRTTYWCPACQPADGVAAAA
jgi:formamidopyrimidine-DNA glycosylase